ncbi:MAG TPA: NAD(P)/FAD-dependent oxidoreductase [Anaerolineales bacterium]|nr:NAD(P)/FAD-dependent oxidoreductase [Anaerolineales bacterium]
MSKVVIIGGGPAGSAMGCYLSMAGIENVIFEGANHPRPHVGESMVTSSTRVFKEIGFLPTMEKEGFIKKYGASWHAPANTGRVAIEFGEFPQEGIDQDYTYHVDRGKFDNLLLKHAESLGSKVYQGVHVKQVLFEGTYAKGVRATIAGQTVDIPADIVVDATGRQTLLGRQLGVKKKDPIFNQYAVHAWFENVNRGSGGSADHIHIYFLPVERGWVWQIPINETVTSMGVVAEKEEFKKANKDVEAYFYAQVETNLNLKEAMRDAVRVNEFRTEGDYSYSMTKFAGDGYVMIGDAARFVDPIFSSGVSVALYSAKYASDQIKLALEQQNFSEEILKPYEVKLRGGVEIWYEFIRLYYKLLPLFTYFIQNKQHRLQVLQLLQGEVYNRGEVPVLQAMRDFIERVENSDNHLFKGKLTEIPIDTLPDLIGAAD